MEWWADPHDLHTVVRIRKIFLPRLGIAFQKGSEQGSRLNRGCIVKEATESFHQEGSKKPFVLLAITEPDMWKVTNIQEDNYPEKKGESILWTMTKL